METINKPKGRVERLILSFSLYFVGIIFLTWLANLLFFGEIFSLDSFKNHLSDEMVFSLFFAFFMTLADWFDNYLVSKRMD
jgi:hypothetical protein